MLSVADGMALAAAVVWAVTVLLYRKLAAVDPAALNLFKNAASLALLLGTMLVLRVPFDAHRSPRDWVLLGTSGVLGLAVADTLFFAGLRRIDASVAAICDCAYAPTVLLLSVLVLGEPLRIGVLFGAPLVIAGLFFATWQPRARRGAPVDRVGVAYVILGVFVTALGIVLAKPALARSELVEATAVRLAFGTAGMVFLQLVRGRLREGFALFRPQRAWRFAVPATFFGGYIGMILWLGGMRLGAASRTALLNQLGAIFVLLLSRLLGDALPWRRWFGAALAVSGACVVLAF